MKISNSIPVNSVLYNQSQSSFYKDSVRHVTKRNDVQSWELVAAFFHSAPTWVKLLLKLRNDIVKHFGLKVGSIDLSEVCPPFESGRNFCGFKLYSVKATEAIMGEDDVHLDFRISFIVDHGNELIMSTLVNINNTSGKVYMFVVKPFHRLLVSIMIKKMCKLIDEKSLPYYALMEEQ